MSEILQVKLFQSEPGHGLERLEGKVNEWLNTKPDLHGPPAQSQSSRPGQFGEITDVSLTFFYTVSE